MNDPEIEAMSAVAVALSDLENEAQRRIVRWAADRYGVTLTKQNRFAAEDGAGDADDSDAEVDAEKTGAEVPAYEHFADLYDAAGPNEKEEKLLVCAYWHQMIQGHATFQAHELNRDLRDLGHRVDHISEALAAIIRKKPALILQLRKSGNTQQARKTYKLSGEGVKAVEQMIQSDR